MIEGCQEFVIFGQATHSIQADRVKSLEDIPLVAMQRCAVVLIDEALDFLEACDDPLFLC